MGSNRPSEKGWIPRQEAAGSLKNKQNIQQEEERGNREVPHGQGCFACRYRGSWQSAENSPIYWTGDSVDESRRTLFRLRKVFKTSRTRVCCCVVVMHGQRGIRAAAVSTCTQAAADRQNTIPALCRKGLLFGPLF